MNSRPRIEVKARIDGRGKILTVFLTKISYKIKSEKELGRENTKKLNISGRVKMFFAKNARQNYFSVNHLLLTKEEQKLESS